MNLRTMTLRPCPHECEIRTALDSGHWPHACAPEVRAHAALCTACGNLILLSQAFRAERAAAGDSAQLPPPSLLWWRAQLRRRNAAEQRLGKPLLGAHLFALSLTALAAFAILVGRARAGLAWLAGLRHAGAFQMANAASRLDTSPDTSPGTLAWLQPGHSAPYLLVALALLALAAGAVLFFGPDRQQDGE